MNTWICWTQFSIATFLMLSLSLADGEARFFDEGEDTKIVDLELKDLEDFGIKAETIPDNPTVRDSDLTISFEVEGGKQSKRDGFELLLTDKYGNILFVVQNPFPKKRHEVRYVLARDMELLVLFPPPPDGSRLARRIVVPNY